MDVFGKLFAASHSILQEFMRRNHSRLPTEIQNEINSMVGKIILKCTEVYKTDIMRMKYNLNIDLNNSEMTSEMARDRFLKRFHPCEVCCNTRITHLCHIIPRSEGGDDSPGNLVSLCPNHHYLFDRDKLTQKEWNSIKWKTKAEKSFLYAMNVRLPMHQMYWKYNTSQFSGCQCGSQDFMVSYSEEPSIVREGGIEVFPGIITKHMKCQNCAEEYSLSKYRDIEYTWWQYYVMNSMSKK